MTARERIFGILLVSLAVACAPPGADDTAADATSRAPTAAEIGQALGDDRGFAEPIRLEIWSYLGSPTAAKLAEADYMTTADENREQYVLTDKARALEVEQDYFLEDVPIYFFPVGTRELVEIVKVEVPEDNSPVVVGFSYRKAANTIGQELLDAGLRVKPLQPEHDLDGTALFTRIDGEWKAILVAL